VASDVIVSSDIMNIACKTTLLLQKLSHQDKAEALRLVANYVTECHELAITPPWQHRVAQLALGLTCAILGTGIAFCLGLLVGSVTLHGASLVAIWSALQGASLGWQVGISLSAVVAGGTAV